MSSAPALAPRAAPTRPALPQRLPARGGRCRCSAPPQRQQQDAAAAAAAGAEAAAQPVSSVVEQQQQQLSSPPPPERQPGAAGAAAAAAAAAAGSDSKEPLFKALLAIILQLSAQEQQEKQQPPPQQQQQPQQQQEEEEQQPASRLEAFVASQGAATSIPFIAWLADLEADASGPAKAQLGALCERLLLLRERQDRTGQEALYADSLRLLSGGDEAALARMDAEPRAYALALAEGLTGGPVTLSGYGPTYDALLAVAPPAALTPAAVVQGHALAEELATDLSARRKSTLAAMLGRVRLDSLAPEQQAALLGPRPAARILDLLLSLDSADDRLALLPDCFAPPSGDAEPGALDDASSSDTDELWCTPMQLLNEIDGRLAAATAAAAAAAGDSPRAALPGAGGGGGSGQAALPGAGGGGGGVEALEQLRQHISSSWLASLPQGGSPQSE